MPEPDLRKPFGLTIDPASFPPLPNSEFEIIYADPPWDYRGQLQHAGKGSEDSGGAARHYPTVTLTELKKLEISRIAADSSLLFMWSTNPHLDQAIELRQGMGVCLGDGRLRLGQGTGQPRLLHDEPVRALSCLQARKDPRTAGSRNIRQLVSEKRDRHSQKPEEVRRRIDAMFPSLRKIELFARSRNRGWKSWGLEAHSA